MIENFLLGFQFIGSSMHKPEGLPQISDVVLDKVRLLSGLGVCRSDIWDRYRFDTGIIWWMGVSVR